MRSIEMSLKEKEAAIHKLKGDIKFYKRKNEAIELERSFATASAGYSSYDESDFTLAVTNESENRSHKSSMKALSAISSLGENS